ncbi:MAG: ATP-binding cassette domain-containing protein [Deltaproteobacteria bacterium]|nr:ATP-binding cassette domain-containing protein [Deltaproteobacteria bacterium]
MIEIRELCKNFGTFPALTNISFEVNRGEILGFLGPNGAGKTTTMKIITCYMHPTQGDVLVDGISVYDDTMAIRQKIGYLPESNPLYMDMSVIEYLKFIAQVRSIPVSKVKDRLRQIATTCGLTEVLGQTIGTLSKGYRQRVGLAQAMVHDPDILILDEPTSGLDPNQIVEIRNLIKTLGREKTVVLSTHILPEVEATCDRIIVIDKGSIVEDGSVAELQARFQGAENIFFTVKAGNDGVEDKLRSHFARLHVEKRGQPADGTWEFTLSAKERATGQDLREDVFAFVVSQGWILLEMTRTETSLEEIFHKLTLGQPNN